MCHFTLPFQSSLNSASPVKPCADACPAQLSLARESQNLQSTLYPKKLCQNMFFRVLQKLYDKITMLIM